jgi:hypothetical protein
MRVGRISLSPFSQPQPDPLSGLLATMQKEAMARQYASGVKDGFRITLELLLGQPAAGGVPFDGELPDDVRAWAETALTKVKSV